MSSAVTGGAGGIGTAIGRALGAAGQIVAVVDIDGEGGASPILRTSPRPSPSLRPTRRARSRARRFSMAGNSLLSDIITRSD